MNLNAMHLHQKKDEFYLAVVPVAQLLERMAIDRVSPENKDGYQRPPIRGRLRAVAKYLDKEEGQFPTSVEVNIRSEDLETANKKVKFTLAQNAENGEGEVGSLSIPDAVKWWVVDGQHRIEGCRLAIEEEGMEWVRNYTIPISITVGKSRYDEMRAFWLRNARQKGVPPDVAERHLARMLEEQGEPHVEQFEGSRKAVQARALKVVDFLRTKPGQPWHNRIIFPGETKTAQHVVRQHTLVSSMMEIFKHDFIRNSISETDLGNLLVNYWSAIERIYPKAFKEPVDYNVLKTAGIYCFHMIFPQVLELCRERKDYSPEYMEKVLRNIDMDEEDWSSDVNIGDPWIFGTGMQSLRALAAKLRNSLPRVKPFTE